MDSKSKIIVVGGNIGAGKSTVLSKFKEWAPDIPVYEEDVKEWNKDGLLELYCGFKKRYAEPLQTRIMSYHRRLIGKINNSNDMVCVMERHMVDSVYVFSLLLMNHDYISSNVFNKWTTEAISNLPYAFIYIDTPVGTGSARAAMRNRRGERVSLDYMRDLDTNHSVLMRVLFHNSVSIYTVDGEKHPDEVAKEVISIVNSFKRMIKMDIIREAALAPTPRSLSPSATSLYRSSRFDPKQFVNSKISKYAASHARIPTTH